jgi:hypothetical protein
MHVGWLWSPGVGPDEPISLGTLRDRVADVHGRIRAFCQRHDPDDLGRAVLYDPVIGVLNIIQAVRVGVYHDELHYRDVMALAARMGP